MNTQENNNSLITQEAMEAISKTLTECPEVVEITISDDAGLQTVSDAMVSLKKNRDKLDAMRKALKEPYTKKAQLIDEFFRPALQMLEKTLSVYEAGYSQYIRKREEERLRLEAQAQAEAEAARQKAIREAEELRNKAHKASEEGDLEAAAEAQAKAEEALISAESMVAPVVERIAPQGVVQPKAVYIAEVNDKRKAIAALTANEILLCFVVIDEQGLSDFATKRGPVEIDGIRWRKEYRHKRAPKRKGGAI